MRWLMYYQTKKYFMILWNSKRWTFLKVLDWVSKLVLCCQSSALLTMPKHLTVWITTNCGISWRDGNTRPPDLPPEKSVYLIYMQSTLWEMLGWRKHKLESRLPGEISITSDMQMTPPYGRKWRRTKEPFYESERGEWKSWLKAQHSEN